ncbi:YiiX/YebB-like N1pC/P60 family cysteine hydrolase [Ralstonia syzygii]|uniref:YiiX/YebB-like N1pC/P60 family cysteine hydrolase n=1 Tax=Ralstonia syzygii TaxID=28097 RepID=UPI0018D12957|nr:YiiX/YebB-like N1pC/P60 family cysteine hydrolase [Ralstonia syzygii]
MSSVQLLFSTTSSPLSWVIRACTWSAWSHVALVDGDQVIESIPGHGVRRVLLTEALRDTSHHELVSLPGRAAMQVLAAAASQIGLPYDYSAVLGIGLHRDWQEEDAWFCSELIAWAFQQAGVPLFRADCIRRVTPQHLYMLPAMPEMAFN